MPKVTTNGISLSYERIGTGAPVLFIMGSGASGRVWTIHQTPALTRHGYECITFDNRGIPPSDVPPGQYSLEDMVTDTKGLIDELGLAPCHIVGASLGSLIAQELAMAFPEAVRSMTLIATRGRSDATRRALHLADQALASSGVTMPGPYLAAMMTTQMLSPATLNDDTAVTPWLDIFELSGDRDRQSAGQAWAEIDTDRRPRLRDISAPCQVIAFLDDVIAPPHLGSEVADAIPDCNYVELADCGHLGFLERPEEVNAGLVEFLKKHS